MLYHLLPIVFWLSAAGGIVLWVLFAPFDFHPSALLPAALSLLAVWIISRIKRHTSSEEECFQVALLLGIAAYWMPSVLFLIIPVWGYLIYMNLLGWRSFFATLIGLAVVAIWAAVISLVTPFAFPLSIDYNLWVWVPTGSILVAWLASKIARHILQLR